MNLEIFYLHIFDILSVKRFTQLFPKPVCFINKLQNICFVCLFLETLYFPQKMWIMWITLWITRFYLIFQGAKCGYYCGKCGEIRNKFFVLSFFLCIMSIHEFVNSFFIKIYLQIIYMNFTSILPSTIHPCKPSYNAVEKKGCRMTATTLYIGSYFLIIVLD